MKKYRFNIALLFAVVFLASSCQSVKRSGCPGRDYSSYKMNKHRFGHVMTTQPDVMVRSFNAYSVSLSQA